MRKILLAAAAAVLLAGLAIGATTVTKGLIGQEDHSFGPATSTFTRATSTGATLTMKKIPRYWDNNAFTDNLTLYGKGFTGDNTGRIQGFTIGAAAGTDNGVFNNITVSGTPTFTDNTINGSKVIDNTLTVGKVSATGTASNSTYLRGDGAWSTGLTTFRGALVYKDPSQSIPDNTLTTLTFEYENYDTNTIHSSTINNSRLTIPTGVTRVRLTGGVTFNDNATGYRFIGIRKNGGTISAGYGVTTSPAFNATTFYQAMMVATSVISVTAGDYFELKAWQNSGSSLDVLGTWPDQTWFSVEIIE